ncbi:MAG: hypothetical protein VXW31_07565 [Planctomycetota bacterium]|nr:hypothetical protein [Planctomycetota bacterium]
MRVSERLDVPHLTGPLLLAGADTLLARRGADSSGTSREGLLSVVGVELLV